MRTFRFFANFGGSESSLRPLFTEKDQSRAALLPTAPVFVYRFGEISRSYTTLCKPSVFSISSITPSVATIMMVASAAMVGSK